MAPPTGLDICAFSKAVNSVKNNGPHLLEPLPSHLQTKVISHRRARWSLGGAQIEKRDYRKARQPCSAPSS